MSLKQTTTKDYVKNINTMLRNYKIDKDKLIEFILNYIDGEVLSLTDMIIYEEFYVQHIARKKNYLHRLKVKKESNFVAMANRYKKIITNDNEWINREEDYSVLFNISTLTNCLNDIECQEYINNEYYSISDLLDEDDEGYTDEDFVLKILNIEFMRIIIHELYHVTNYYRDTDQYNTEYLVDKYAVMCVKDFIKNNNGEIPTLIKILSLKELIEEKLENTNKNTLQSRLCDMIAEGVEIKYSDEDRALIEPIFFIKTLDSQIVQFRRSRDIAEILSNERIKNILLQHKDHRSGSGITNKELLENIEIIHNIVSDIINDKKRIPDDIPGVIFDSRDFHLYRYIFIKILGFANVTKKFAKSLKEKVINNGKCLEIMCGTGALSKALQDEGVDIIATDNYSIDYDFKTRHTEVEKIDCLDAIRKYGKEMDYIICSWIPYGNPIGYEALKLMNEINPECKMISINESYGCCANDDFFDHSKTIVEFNNDNDNWLSYTTGEDTVNYKTWEGLHDYVSVIQYSEEVVEY